SFLDAVREGIPVEVVRYEGTVFAISQLRIRMGTVPLPEAEDDVFDIVDACYRQAMIIHQHSAHALFQA
ncbi:MAG TPA: hypothetical protein VLL08_27765, partial [Kineosporiaceae bacterium]|nr:hypothetical protein [Kineosporiaceae bacterium]